MHTLPHAQSKHWNPFLKFDIYIKFFTTKIQHHQFHNTQNKAYNLHTKNKRPKIQNHPIQTRINLLVGIHAANKDSAIEPNGRTGLHNTLTKTFETTINHPNLQIHTGNDSAPNPQNPSFVHTQLPIQHIEHPSLPSPIKQQTNTDQSPPNHNPHLSPTKTSISNLGFQRINPSNPPKPIPVQLSPNPPQHTPNPHLKTSILTRIEPTHISTIHKFIHSSI